MSTSSFNSMKCITADPDIAGIGVRTSIYAQNFLSFAPAVFALLEGQVSLTALEALETQSTTILITAFALLVSTVVQAIHNGLTNFDAVIILNLSWMNNTNLFIYFFLYVCHRRGLPSFHGVLNQMGRRWKEGSKLDEELRVSRRKKVPKQVQQASGSLHEIKQMCRNPVFWIGSIHLSLMSVVGLWLWSHPVDFGNSKPCSMTASLTVVGMEAAFGSERLRTWSLLVYSLLAIPGVNLLAPVALFYAPVAFSRLYPLKLSHWGSAKHTIAALTVIASMNVVFLVDTESVLRKNQALVDTSGAGWTFGQTLAILLLLVPLRDLLETLLERRPKRIGETLLNAVLEEHPDVVKHCLFLGVSKATKDACLRTAFLSSDLEAASLLIRAGADADVKDLLNDDHAQEAVEKRDMVLLQFLVDKGCRINMGGTRGRTPLFHAAIEGYTDVALCLLEGDANPNVLDYDGNCPLHFATQHKHKDIIILLLKYGAEINMMTRVPRQDTSLHIAIQDWNLELVRLLLENGADPNAPWDRVYRHTPLGYALSRLEPSSSERSKPGDMAIIRTLIEYGGNVNVIASNDGSRTLLEEYASSTLGYHKCDEGYLEFLSQFTGPPVDRRVEPGKGQDDRDEYKWHWPSMHSINWDKRKRS